MLKNRFLFALLLPVLATAAVAQDGGAKCPLVYDVENTGSNFAKPLMPEPEKLPVIRELPDALEGVASFADVPIFSGTVPIFSKILLFRYSSLT